MTRVQSARSNKKNRSIGCESLNEILLRYLFEAAKCVQFSKKIFRRVKHKAKKKEEFYENLEKQLVIMTFDLSHGFSYDLKLLSKCLNLLIL
jgi:hypothetical protein